MAAILVETPAYLRWRRTLGRRPFDIELAVERPEDPALVRYALRDHLPAALVLPGFERYAGSAFALAAGLQAPPWPAVGPNFMAPDKDGQRRALAGRGNLVSQPNFVTLGEFVQPGPALEHLGFPQVVKPTDGGGGLGVFRVEDEPARDEAIAMLQEMENYGGGRFSNLMVEELVEGAEYSLQAISFRGQAIVVAVCEKLVRLDAVAGHPNLRNFREIGHIAMHGQHGPPALLALAQECLDATGYRSGAFHVDVILGSQGPVFLEMGFRLSGGGLVSLVERATGMRWAELVFEIHLGGHRPVLSEPNPGASGQINASATELDTADLLRADGAPVEVLRSDNPPEHPIVMSAIDTARLTPDRLRHGGFSGRILADGDGPDVVRGWLDRCFSTPARY
jgi:hypothetical protein